MERKIEVFQGLLSTRKRWKIAHSYILHLPSPFSCYIGLTTPYFPLSPSFFLEILLSDRHQTTPPSLLHHYHSFPPKLQILPSVRAKQRRRVPPSPLLLLILRAPSHRLTGARDVRIFHAGAPSPHISLPLRTLLARS